jgi:two-component system response regulator YesN
MDKEACAGQLKSRAYASNLYLFTQLTRNKIIQNGIKFYNKISLYCNKMYATGGLMDSLYESAGKVAGIYEKACRLKCFVVDTSQPDGLLKRQEAGFCAVCASEQVKRSRELKCENIHRDGLFQAEKWGGKYEHLCPAGLAFICSPLEDEKSQYGLVAGPFLMVELSDFIEEDLERFFPGETPKKLAAESAKLPYFYSGRVSYLADMLAILASYAAKKDSMQVRVIEQIAKSQSEVFYFVNGTRDRQEENYLYPIEQEKLLQGYIAQGNKAASQQVLNEILGHIFFSSGGSFDYIKARIIELVVILSRAAIEGGADISEVFGLNSDYIRHVQSFKSLDELNHWLAKVLNRFTNSVFDFSKTKHSDLIKKVVAYIRGNYMNKISLNDISSLTGVSVSYLSKVFKEEMDCSLSAYINQVRVENAKLFLLSRGIPLTEVAYLSGFEDQSYFSKVFKKVTGVTPGRYRVKKGNI